MENRRLEMNEDQYITCHGSFSDGNVHSHIDHLFAILRQARAEGKEHIRLHILTDGRCESSFRIGLPHAMEIISD